MYVRPNFPSRAALVRAVNAGEEVVIFSPGPFPPNYNGTNAVEGPHFPKAHSWYAQVKVEAGRVVKVIS